MEEKINTLKNSALAEFSKAQTEDELKAIEVKYLGRQGLFNDIMKSLKNLSIEEKKTIGKLANETKKELELSISKNYKRIEDLRLSALAEDEWLDISVKRKKLEIGHRQLMSKFIDNLENIFAKIGFEMVEGPEIEKEFYNFDQLNIPSTHPARDMHDTFWIENLDKYEFLGVMFNIPQNAEKLLVHLYGKDWKTPKINTPASNYGLYLSIKFLIKKKSKSLYKIISWIKQKLYVHNK